MPKYKVPQTVYFFMRKNRLNGRIEEYIVYYGGVLCK